MRSMVACAELHLLGDLEVELGELVGIEMIEGEVLEVPLDAGHAEAVGDRRVDLQRLARDPAPRLGRHVLQGRHVVQPVGELDDDHPDVLRRGEDHLAEGLGLRLVAPHVLVAADLGDAVDQAADLVAELLLQHLAGGQRVLEHVVQQPHRHAGLVEVEVGQQVGDVERMDHVRLAGAADLILVHARRRSRRPSAGSPDPTGRPCAARHASTSSIRATPGVVTGGARLLLDGGMAVPRARMKGTGSRRVTDYKGKAGVEIPGPSPPVPLPTGRGEPSKPFPLSTVGRGTGVRVREGGVQAAP